MLGQRFQIPATSEYVESMLAILPTVQSELQHCPVMQARLVAVIQDRFMPPRVNDTGNVNEAGQAGEIESVYGD